MRILQVMACLCFFILTLASCQRNQAPSNNQSNANQSATQNGNSNNSVQPNSPTKIGQFLSKKGELIIKNFYDLGTINGKYRTKAVFTAVVAYQPGKEDERIRGLRIDISQPLGYSDRSNSSSLDLEEIESLSKALEYMLQLKDQWKGTNKDNSEVMFATLDNFKVGFAQNTSLKDVGDIFAIMMSGVSGVEAGCVIPIEELTSVKAKAEKALELLNQK